MATLKALQFHSSYSSSVTATSFRRILIPPLDTSHLHYSLSTVFPYLHRTPTEQLSVWKILNASVRCTASYSRKEDISGKETMGWYGDDGRHIRVSVWWDFENCGVPVGVNVYKVVPRILAALRASGIKGPMTISGYGDIQQLSRSTQEALSATGIYLSHIPRGGKNSADRALLADLVLWTSQNPPPAHLFLISGDGDFSSILHRLRMKNYNILLANADTSSAALCNAASIVWQWNGLVRGKALLGKQFNHPPDGIPGSWYGQAIGPIEDVFRDIELQTNNETMPEISEGVETESPQETDVKPRPIPKTVMTQIACILNSYSQGLSIQQLQSEIVRHEIEVDKDYFGHKKFLRFLLAMPNTLKLQRRVSSDGKTWTYYAYAKSMEASKIKSRPSPMDGVKEQHKGLEQVEMNGEMLKSSSQLVSKEQHLDKEVPLSAGVKKIQADASDGQSHDKKSQQDNFFGRVLRNWFGIGLINDSGKVDDSKSEMIKTKNENANDKNGEIDGTGADGRKLGIKNPSSPGNNSKQSRKTEFSFKQLLFGSPSCTSSFSGIRVKKGLNEKFEGHSENFEVKKSASPSILHRFSQHWKGWLPRLRGDFGQTSPCDSDFASSQEKISSSSQGFGTHELVTLTQSDYSHYFSKPEFWDEVKSYLQSLKGSVLISKAKSREDMAKMLQKHGPYTFRQLRPNYLRHLVNLLVDEKKWLECSTGMFPFKLNLPGKSDCTHPASKDEVRSSTFHHVKAEAEVKSTSLTEQPKLQDVKCKLDGNTSDINNAGRATDADQNLNFEELKDWLIKYIKSHGSIPVASLQISFYQQFNSTLDCNIYGFATVEDLISACSDEISVIIKAGVPIVFNEKVQSKELSRREVIDNCKKLLGEVLHDNPDGYYISSFKSLFRQRYGYVLDQKMLGYGKLSSFLQAMPRVEIRSSVIYSTDKFHKRVHAKEKSAAGNSSDAIKEERNTTCKDGNTEEAQPAYGDFAEKDKPICDGATVNHQTVWDELGPIVVEGSENCISSTDMNRQLNGSHDGLQVERQKDLEEMTCLSCDDSEHSDSLACKTERFRPLDNHSSAEGSSALRIGETKSILEVLDAWRNDSDTFITPKQCGENLDGLIDCSVYSNFLDSHRFTGESSRSHLTAEGFKNRIKCRKTWAFVHETSDTSNNDAEESLVDSILSTLKKPTNMTLDKRIP